MFVFLLLISNLKHSLLCLVWHHMLSFVQYSDFLAESFRFMMLEHILHTGKQSCLSNKNVAASYEPPPTKWMVLNPQWVGRPPLFLQSMYCGTDCPSGNFLCLGRKMATTLFIFEFTFYLKFFTYFIHWIVILAV